MIAADPHENMTVVERTANDLTGASAPLLVIIWRSKLEFLDYDAARGKWVVTHEAPAGCSVLLRDGDYSQRFCLTTGGSILEYRNGQWVVEFGVE